jgi:hypothetical protein
MRTWKTPTKEDKKGRRWFSSDESDGTGKDAPSSPAAEFIRRPLSTERFDEELSEDEMELIPHRGGRTLREL